MYLTWNDGSKFNFNLLPHGFLWNVDLLRVWSVTNSCRCYVILRWCQFWYRLCPNKQRTLKHCLVLRAPLTRAGREVRAAYSTSNVTARCVLVRKNFISVVRDVWNSRIVFVRVRLRPRVCDRTIGHVFVRTQVLTFSRGIADANFNPR